MLNDILNPFAEVLALWLAASFTTAAAWTFVMTMRKRRLRHAVIDRRLCGHLAASDGDPVRGSTLTLKRNK